MSTPLWNVNTFVFKQEDQSVRMNEQRTNDGAGEYCDWNSKGSCQQKLLLFFVKFEGCIFSSLGARSIPVSRQAGRQADETLMVLNNFKIL